jgi:hypothetical protein
MSRGIPSENLLIPSFMTFPMSDCAAAAAVAFIIGMNGVALFCVVETTAPRVQDQRIIEEK